MSTLGNCVRDELRRMGVSQAAGFRIEIVSTGEVIQIDSTGHPALQREVDPSDVRVTRTASSKAGVDPTDAEPEAESEAEAEGAEAPTEG